MIRFDLDRLPSEPFGLPHEVFAAAAYAAVHVVKRVLDAAGAQEACLVVDTPKKTAYYEFVIDGKKETVVFGTADAIRELLDNMNVEYRESDHSRLMNLIK